MVAVRPEDVDWLVFECRETAEFKTTDRLDAVKLILCDFFSNSGKGCSGRIKNTQCISSLEDGSKVVKTRVALPGQGKRGGLRVCFVVRCEDKQVIVAGAWIRRDDPDEADFLTASVEAAKTHPRPPKKGIP